MTSPQPVEQEPTDSPLEEAAIAALALYFASAAAVSAVTLPADLAADLAALGLSRIAVRAASRLVMAPPLTGRNRHGSPTPGAAATLARHVAADEPTQRARFLINAARRLTQARLDRAPMAAAVRTEARYLRQHRAAGRRRAQAAAAMDRLAAEKGPYLRWKATLDGRTTPDCAALHDRVFTVDQPLISGGKVAVPGAMHSTCRCDAVPALGAGRRPVAITAA